MGGTSVVTIPTTTTPTTPPPTILSQNSGYIATRDTKFLPHLNGDPGSKTQNLKSKTQNPKTQKPKSVISCYNGTMNIKLLTLGPQTFTTPQWTPQEAKHKIKKTQTPKTQNPN